MNIFFKLLERRNKMERICMLLCIVACLSPTVNASIHWENYDDFSGRSLDDPKWSASNTYAGHIPIIDNGKAKLNVGDYAWFSHSTLRVLDSSAIGIKGDLAMSNVDITGATAGRALLELKMDFGNKYTASSYILFNQTGFSVRYAIKYDNEEISKYLITETGYSSGDILNIGLAARNGIVEFYKNGSSAYTFNDELTHSFITQGIKVDAWTLSCCSSNTLDNVSILVPEPMTLLLFGIGGLFLKRKVMYY
jgi:hypothetical protein